MLKGSGTMWKVFKIYVHVFVKCAKYKLLFEQKKNLLQYYLITEKLVEHF